MLPGTDSTWIAYTYRFITLDGTHDIGDQPVFRPVTAADNIARSRRGECHALLCEKRIAICRSHQLSTPLLLL